MKSITQEGFTLLEVLVCCVVMTVMFLGLYSLFSSLSAVNQRANNLTIATQVTQQQLELYRNLPYNSISTGTTNLTSALSSYPSLGASRSASAIVTQTSTTGLKQVEIDVNYSDRGIAKSTTAITLVAANGMNQ